MSDDSAFFEKINTPKNIKNHHFAYIDLIAGDVEIQVFFCLENGRKLTEIRPLEMVHHGLADHHHLLGGFVSAGIHTGNS